MTIIDKDTQFILGAKDPEMFRIARLLNRTSYRFTFATDHKNERVTGTNAYSAAFTESVIDWAKPIAWVECSIPHRQQKHHSVIDHHMPGHPGYGMAPKDFLRASSLGQIAHTLNAPVFKDNVLAAAADHCLIAAYEGKCPGVSHAELRDWRANNKSRALGISLRQYQSILDKAIRTIQRRTSVNVAGHNFQDCMNVGIPQLPEACAVAGMAAISSSIESNGIARIFVTSPNPVAIDDWMQWARNQPFLCAVYGDPARGFAGAAHGTAGSSPLYL